MNFQEACEVVVKQAQEENRVLHLYKNRIGNFTWGVSHRYWSDWLFKAYPGGRKELSVEGTKLMQSESSLTKDALDGAIEPLHTGIPETCEHPDCVRLFQTPRK